jgi:hypothetical protein
LPASCGTFFARSDQASYARVIGNIASDLRKNRVFEMKVWPTILNVLYLSAPFSVQVVHWDP